MKKKLTLLILCLPVLLFAQTQIKDGSLIIDFGKNKKKAQADTTQQQHTYPSDEEEEEEAPKPKKEKKQKSNAKSDEDFNPKRDGLFKGLFSAGLNACQVDGDNEYGYKYLGANVGVGAMVRFHKNMSVSMEIAYAMRGARARFTSGGANANFFRTNFDYVEVPIAFNVHDKKLVMFSAGLMPAVLVRYREWDRVNGNQINYDNPPFGQPRRFDLSAFGGFYFVIKQQFVLGARFSYSVLSLRGAEPGTRVNGQYHNVLTFRFMYVLGAVKKKK